MSPERLAAIVQLVLCAWLALLAANVLYGLYYPAASTPIAS